METADGMVMGLITAVAVHIGAIGAEGVVPSVTAGSLRSTPEVGGAT